MPNNESRQYGKCKIGDNTKGAVQISQRNYYVHADAVTGVRLVPIVRNGMALQQGNEEKDYAPDHCAHGCRINDPGVSFFVDNSEEEPCE